MSVLIDVDLLRDGGGATTDGKPDRAMDEEWMEDASARGAAYSSETQRTVPRHVRGSVSAFHFLSCVQIGYEGVVASGESG